MAIVKGRGFASVNYPTGMNLGGDPTQALIHCTTLGDFVVTLSSVDLGQGIKTVGAQIGAETLGVPVESVRLDLGDTDTGPHCMGTFASRLTHRAGNAIIMAAKEARQTMLEVAAEELEVNATDLETDGRGRIQVVGAPSRSISVMDVALAAHFKHGKTISGRGIYMKPKSEPVPETGEMDPDSAQAHACTVADVEVDTETGEVRVVRLISAYEIGRAINPNMARQQIIGGAWMGISHTLFETTAPYYPSQEHAPGDFNEYLMPALGELTEVDGAILQRPSSTGPFGAKGLGEMTANPPIGAIANAIFNATGVRIYHLPITPERVLRGIEALAATPDRVPSRPQKSDASVGDGVTADQANNF
jgi:CO/xanthine dehydrogenase Mo-binding subunit